MIPRRLSKLVAPPSVRPAPCPACRRNNSSSSSTSALLPLNFSATALSSSSSNNRASTSWASLSQAGQALFVHEGASESEKKYIPPRPKATLQDSRAGAEFLAELKLAQPYCERLWTYFSALNLAGETHLLNADHYHELIKKLHQPPPANLDVTISTRRAQQYLTRVDFVRSKMTKAGMHQDGGIEKAVLKQMAALKYCPGVFQIWDRMIDRGRLPSRKMCVTVFDTITGWIMLHDKVGGRKLAAIVAAPLVARTAGMIEDLGGDVARVESVLEAFLKIVRAGHNVAVFKIAMKQIYGFDMDYPGARIATTSEAGFPYRVMGEKEVEGVLRLMSVEDNLSGMMGVFEVFDSPASTSRNVAASPSSHFFDASFSSPEATPSAGLEEDPPAPPHPIGTKAYILLIDTAGRLGQGHIVRHYFRQLSVRWEALAEEKLATLEAAVGIVHGPDPIAELPSSESASLVDPLSSDELLSPPVAPSSELNQTVEEMLEEETLEEETSEVSFLDSAAALLSPATASSVAPFPRPARAYAMPSSLVYTVFRNARAHYDHVTAQYIRARTLFILNRMTKQAERIEAIRARLLPVAHIEGSETEPEQSGRALRALSYELAHVSLHRLQLRLILPPIKATSNILRAYARLRRLLSDLRKAEKKLGLGATFAQNSLDSSPGPFGAPLSPTAAPPTAANRRVLANSLFLRRATSKIVVAKRQLIQTRMGALVVQGKTTGRWQWEECKRKLATLERQEARLRESFSSTRLKAVPGEPVFE